MAEIGKYVRGLWGSWQYKDLPITTKRIYHASTGRQKVENDIQLNLLSPYTPEFTTFCFGEENYKYLSDKGMKCELIDKRPVVWDMNTEWWRHKVEVIKYGLQMTAPIIYLDWDCVAIRKIPDNIWELMEKKDAIQTPLKIYSRKEAFWRKENKRMVAEGCFVYLRNKGIADDLIALWQKHDNKYLDEVLMALYMDNLMDGWKGADEYYRRFEPPFSIPRDHQIESGNFAYKGKPFFCHITYRSTEWYLKWLKAGHKWDELVGKGNP